MTEFKLEQQVAEELNAEKSRDRWIAVQAAERIGAGECIDTIETEPLDALCEWLRSELEDRSRATEHFMDDIPF
jgi:hypothetical protein